MQTLNGVIVNKLTMAQYREKKANNQIAENESYIITDLDEQLDNLIIYKESLDINNPIILRDLPDGFYKIYGYIKYYAGQSGIAGADPFALISIAQGASKTYVQVIDYNGNHCYEVTDEGYTNRNDSGWIDLTLSGDVVAYNSSSFPVRYRKMGNRVRIEGAVKGITAKSTIIANIPSGFRPIRNQYYLGSGPSGRVNTYEIRNNGNLVFVNTTASSMIDTDYYFIGFEYYID